MAGFTAAQARRCIYNYNDIMDGVETSLHNNFDDMDFDNAKVKSNMESIKMEMVNEIYSIQKELNAITFES